MDTMTSLVSARAASACLVTWTAFSLVVNLDGRTHDGFFDTSDGRIRHGTFLKITTILIEPYVMPHNSTDPGQPQYEGYIVDLLDRLGGMLRFDYELRPVEDGEFGFSGTDGTGRWTGMIGELLDKRADLAAAPMFITKPRENVVQFTHPFMAVHASMVMQKHFQGLIRSLRDVHIRQHLTVGALNRGLIFRTLRGSNDTLVQRVFDRMQNNPNKSFTATNEEGIRRVRDGDYVFILPSSIADYIVARSPCDLIAVNTTFFAQHYAFADEIGSGLLPYLDDAIESLEKTGELYSLYLKWWVNKGDCNTGNDRGAGIRSEHMKNTVESSCDVIRVRAQSIMVVVCVTLLVIMET